MKIATCAVIAAGVGGSVYLHPVAVVAALLLGATAALVLDRRLAVAIVVVLTVAADAGLRVDAAPSWTPPPKGTQR